MKTFKYRSICEKTIYALLHFLIDGICAFSIYYFYADKYTGTEYYKMFLLYNFCAFALQFPVGYLADICSEKYKRSDFAFALAGVLLTIAGAFSHVFVLGLGNAFFHIGGGINSIGEPKDNCGAQLGIFVAPGALGLFVFTLFAKDKKLLALIIGVIAACILAACLYLLTYRFKESEDELKLFVKKDRDYVEA
nr:hypothetical protein [Lachnospiraceae bacterium]